MIHVSLQTAQMPEFFATKVADKGLLLRAGSDLRLFFDGRCRQGRRGARCGGEDARHAWEHGRKVRRGVVTEHG